MEAGFPPVALASPRSAPSSVTNAQRNPRSNAPGAGVFFFWVSRKGREERKEFCEPKDHAFNQHAV